MKFYKWNQNESLQMKSCNWVILWVINEITTKKVEIVKSKKKKNPSSALPVIQGNGQNKKLDNPQSHSLVLRMFDNPHGNAVRSIHWFRNHLMSISIKPSYGFNSLKI